MATLYFITFDDENGDTKDWFVAAESRDQAVAFWQAHNEGDMEGETPENVFIVPAALDDHAPCGVLEWFYDVKVAPALVGA